MSGIHPTAYLHPSAVVCGNVTLGARVSVWATAVIRGDSDSIEIGDDSNIQDGAVVHVDDGVPTKIGKRVGVGHRAIIHGATVEDDCLIAMGAILLNGTVVGSGSIIGAGALCTEGFVVPPNSLAMGVPMSWRLLMKMEMWYGTPTWKPTALGPKIAPRIQAVGVH